VGEAYIHPQAIVETRDIGPDTCEGIVIRRGATVGAGAVVVKDVEPDTIVVGNPARVVRRLEPSV
jgi:serine acetyltransferase